MADARQVKAATAVCVQEGPADVFRDLFPHECAAPIRYRRRSYVYHQGTAVAGIYCLIRGMVALERVDEDGRMAMFGITRPGALLAWNDLVDAGTHRNSAQALTGCELVVVRGDRFRTALRDDERLLTLLMQQTAAQASAYEEHILRLSTLDVQDRLYSTLCALAGSSVDDAGAVEVSTPLLKRDLAAMVGTSPETISRSLKRLEELEVAEFTDRSTFRLHPVKRR
jgi:CRP/FNR family transcriptional regulator